jgi:ATP-binding cassette subfamily B protein
MSILNFAGKMYKYQINFSGLFFLTAISNVFMCIFDSCVPLVVSLLFDSIQQKQNYNISILLLLLNFFGLVISSIVQKKTSSYLGAKVICLMRMLMFEKIQKSENSLSSNSSQAHVLSIFTTSLAILENSVLTTFWKSLGLLLTGICSALILFYYNWIVASLVCISMIFLYYIPNYFLKKSKIYLSQKKTFETKLIDSIQEEISLKRVTKILLLTEFKKKAFEKILHTCEMAQSLYSYYLSLVGNGTFLSTHLIRIFVILFGVYMVLRNQISLIDLTGIYLALGNLCVVVSSFSGTQMEISRGEEALIQIEEFVQYNRKPNKDREQPNKNLLPFAKSIKFENVDFKYGSKQVLSNINLEIKAGQSVAFVGLSGSGKSTILKLMLGDIIASNGSVTYDGIDVKTLKLESLYSQIGVIFQESLLFDDTVLENIRMGKLTASNEDIIESSKRAEIHEDLLKLPKAYETFVGRQNQSLSGGQCQRISIARALISNPSILFLDEATSALDPVSCESIDKTIEKMSGTKTIISVTHRLRSAQNCDQIFVMKNGEIIENGTHLELLEKQGLYLELWEKQNGITLSSDKTQAFISPLLLKHVSLLTELDPEILEKIGKEFEIEMIEKNKIVFSEAEFGDKFYVIASGTVEVTKKNKLNSEMENLVKLQEGDFFGEVALLSREARNATIKTSTDCIFLTLTAQRFYKIYSNLPEIVKEKIQQAATKRK